MEELEKGKEPIAVNQESSVLEGANASESLILDGKAVTAEVLKEAQSNLATKIVQKDTGDYMTLSKLKG